MSTTVRQRKLEKRKPEVNVRMLLAAAILITVSAGLVWLILRGSSPTKGSNGSLSRASSSAPNAQPNFEATVVNAGAAPPGSLPAGMVYIPGGEFSMGALDPTEMVCGGDQPMDDARPLHRVYVDAFFIDATEVTNEQFEAFAKATGYVTIAERKPTHEEFPDAPVENLVAGSAVFSPPPSRFHSTIITVGGATCRVPTGAIPMGQQVI